MIIQRGIRSHLVRYQSRPFSLWILWDKIPAPNRHSKFYVKCTLGRMFEVYLCGGRVSRVCTFGRGQVSYRIRVCRHTYRPGHSQQGKKGSPMLLLVSILLLVLSLTFHWLSIAECEDPTGLSQAAYHQITPIWARSFPSYAILSSQRYQTSISFLMIQVMSSTPSYLIAHYMMSSLVQKKLS